MLSKETGQTDPIRPRQPEETSNQQRTKLKIASLAPYMAEIEKRKRMRSITKRSKKNINESSSKSFRIKDKSVTSLQKETISRTRDITINTLVNKLMEDRGTRERKARSVQKVHEVQFSKTLQNKDKITKTKSNNNFFNDLYVRVRNRFEKDRPMRKKLYQTIEEQRARSQQTGEINMYKISYTNETKPLPDAPETRKKKGNFRRNKYEALNSSLAERPEERAKEQERECIQSDSRIDLDKKQSNVSINKQMDRLAKRQMDVFYRQRNKQINRSVEKSTEKYFNYESYRPTKSKNDIQVFVSTVKNPSIHKVSKSTLDDKSKSKSKEVVNSSSFREKQQKKSELLQYDFDFHGEAPEIISEMENPSEEQCSLRMKEESEFQIQRRKVEIADFNRGGVHLQWSDQDCRVEDI